MEINLKETPLSEIDLSKIDYEKSYVWYENKKDFIKNIQPFNKSYDVNVDDGFYLFEITGQHSYDNGATLHLFYKQCSTCDDEKKPAYDLPCRTCVDFKSWQPKSVNSHPIIIEYEDLGDTVKILKIEGVMTCEEIKKHCGTDILSKYTDGEKRPSMYMDDRSLYVWCERDSQFYFHLIFNGDKIKKESFSDLIDNMKLAAKRLASLIKEKPEIKRIVI
jgi:hypothetical protein